MVFMGSLDGLDDFPKEIIPPVLLDSVSLSEDSLIIQQNH